MEVRRGGVDIVECTQIITIPYSSWACHAEGRQIETANGNWGDAVWSNLVQEVWWLRERQGDEGTHNPYNKKRNIVCWSTFDTFKTGAQLRQ